MNDEDLISKFDSIEDLPVSEELIGAYLEGNLSFEEGQEIENLMHNDSQMAEFMNELSGPEDFNTFDLFNSSHFFIDDTFSESFDLIDSDDFTSAALFDVETQNHLHIDPTDDGTFWTDNTLSQDSPDSFDQNDLTDFNDLTNL